MTLEEIRQALPEQPRPELIERFNIYAAQQKKWLPPDYGKKAYSNMTAEEKPSLTVSRANRHITRLWQKQTTTLNPSQTNRCL